MLKLKGRVITHESQYPKDITNEERIHARNYLRIHANEIRTFLFLLKDKVVTLTSRGMVLELPLSDTLYNAIMTHPTYPVVVYECWLTNGELTLSRQITDVG